MIQHELTRKPSTDSSSLPKGLTKSALLRVDVYSARKSHSLARRDRALDGNKTDCSKGIVRGEWAKPTLRDRKVRVKNLRVTSNASQG